MINTVRSRFRYVFLFSWLVRRVLTPCLHFVQVPAGLSALTNLKFLDLSSNAFVNVDTDFSIMTRLQTLKIQNYLRMERVRQFPTTMVLSDTIANMQSITKLDFMHSVIQALPEALGQLHNLTELVASHCGISQLPASITQLSQLQTLDLAKNLLQVLPADLGRLQNLTSMDLYGNAINALPRSIMDLPQLKWLYYDVATMATLPPAFDLFISSGSTVLNTWVRHF